MNKYKIIEKGNGIGMMEYFSEHWYEIHGLFPQCEKCSGTIYGEDMKCADCGADVYFRKIKSVSMVLGVVDKGYGFTEWLKSVGPNADYISRKAAESGSKLHDVFEKSILGETISAETGEFDLKQWKKYNNWCDWYEGLKITPYHVEIALYGDFNSELAPKPDGISREDWAWMNHVAGTCDLVARIEYIETKGTGKNKVEIPHDDVYICDWKTGNATYETSKLQIAAYAKMYNDLVDKGVLTTPRATKGIIVHVGGANKTKKGLNNVGVKATEVNLNDELESFRDTLRVFNRFNQTIKAPTDMYPVERKLESGLLLPPEEIVN